MTDGGLNYSNLSVLVLPVMQYLPTSVCDGLNLGVEFIVSYNVTVNDKNCIKSSPQERVR